MSNDWVHCNKCFLRFHPKMRFYITECAHIQCDMCAKKCSPDFRKCSVCGRAGVTVLLEKNLQADVRAYFSSPVNLMEKAQTIVSFQLNNYASILKSTCQKYKYVKNELAKQYRLNKELRAEIDKLQKMLKAHQRPGFRPSLTSTQVPGTSSPSLCPSQLSSIQRGSNRMPLQQYTPSLRQRCNTTPVSYMQSPAQTVPSVGSRGSAMSSFNKLIRHGNPYYRM